MRLLRIKKKSPGQFGFLLALLALCCLSVYQTERKLLSSTQSTGSEITTINISNKPKATKTITPKGLSSSASYKNYKIIQWHGKEDLKAFMRAYFDEENLICSSIKQHEEEQQEKPIMNFHFQVTFGCRALFEKAGLGTGNFVAGLYAMRLAARVMSRPITEKRKGGRNVRLSITCSDAHEEQANLILPWLMGDFDSDPHWAQTQAEQYYNGNLTAIQEAACRNIDYAPIGLLHPEMQYELRRMAMALVQPSDHYWKTLALQQHLLQPPSPQYTLYMLPTPSLSAPPLYKEVALNDAILHFRCGDLMDSNHPRFAFIKFSAFAQRIPQDATSIGIVTQPFDDHDDAAVTTETVRALDATATKRHRCKVVVTELVNYLQEQFPKARIQLHNAPQETIALTYARMIMANATIAGISTFGVFASIASFGMGYIRRPDEKSPTNQWLLYPQPLPQIIKRQQQAHTNKSVSSSFLSSSSLVLMEEPDILMVRRVKQMWLEDNGRDEIVKWFRNE